MMASQVTSCQAKVPQGEAMLTDLIRPALHHSRDIIRAPSTGSDVLAIRPPAVSKHARICQALSCRGEVVRPLKSRSSVLGSNRVMEREEGNSLVTGEAITDLSIKICKRGWSSEGGLGDKGANQEGTQTGHGERSIESEFQRICGMDAAA